jgi:hypothetical protein
VSRYWKDLMKVAGLDSAGTIGDPLKAIVVAPGEFDVASVADDSARPALRHLHQCMVSDIPLPSRLKTASR